MILCISYNTIYNYYNINVFKDRIISQKCKINKLSPFINIFIISSFAKDYFLLVCL